MPETGGFHTVSIGLGTVSGTVILPLSRGLELSLYPSPINFPSCNPQRRFRDRFRRFRAPSRRVQHRMHAQLPVNGTGEGCFRRCKGHFMAVPGDSAGIRSPRTDIAALSDVNSVSSSGASKADWVFSFVGTVQGDPRAHIAVPGAVDPAQPLQARVTAASTRSGQRPDAIDRRRLTG